MVLRRLTLACLTVVVLGVSLVAPAGASADGACPQTVFRGSNGGDYPNVDLGWTEGVQGVAHDEGHWFFSTQGSDAVLNDAHLMKIPVGLDLFTGIDPDDSATWPSGVAARGMPQELWDLGYYDFKDLEADAGISLRARRGKAPLHRRGSSRHRGLQRGEPHVHRGVRAHGLHARVSRVLQPA